MARRSRGGRAGTSGGVTPSTGPGVPRDAETFAYEELPEGPPAARRAGSEPEIGRIDAMAQADNERPSEAAAPEGEPAPVAVPPRRRGGFWPGLVGGLLGGAAVTGAGGWYAYEHGPIKPALTKLDAAEAAARTAEGGIATLSGDVGSLKATLEQTGQSIATLGGKLDEMGSSISGEVGGLKAALAQSEQGIAALSQRLGEAETVDRDFASKLDQADRTFRAASEQVIARLEAVNAKLVEVEQAQPADVVDKKTVSDIAAKQSGIEEGQKTVADGLARLEQLVAQSLEAGNQQAAALRTVVDAVRGRLEEIATQQRDLMALKDTLARQEEVDQQHAATLAATGEQVATVRSDLEQRMDDVASRLTALDAARERGVGLSLAAHSLSTAVETGQPFRPTIEVMQQLGPDDAVVAGVITSLEPLAGDGVPTFASLARELGTVEASLAQPAKTAPDDWLGRTRENLQNLVNLHPVDEEAIPGEKSLAAAQQAMLLQDLDGAIAALRPLAEQGNAAAQAWVVRAEQRVQAMAAVETLRQHIKTMLAGQG